MNAPLKPRKRIGRPRVNRPVQKKSGYWARHLVRRPDGSVAQQWFDLGTLNVAIAAAKNAQIIARLDAGEIFDAPATAEVREIETFNAAAARVCRYLAKDGMSSIGDREQRIRRFVAPFIGSLRVNAIRTAHIQELIEKACDEGKSRQTLIHIRRDVKIVFDDLVRQDEIEENPCGEFRAPKVKIPKRAKFDDRPVQVITDEEFVRFVLCDAVPRTIRMMALTSRMLGGMRTGELHALDWSHIDTPDFRQAKVKRGKTRSWTLVEIPDDLATALELWWRDHRCPTEGPVFPISIDSSRGERRGKLSYARVLRKYLLRAGVTRSELHESSEWSKRVDFHSFRRAYASALGEAGTNHQTAMRLTGHRKLETHLRYVTRLRAARAPEAAIPRLGTGLSKPVTQVTAHPVMKGGCHEGGTQEKSCDNGHLRIDWGSVATIKTGQRE